MVYHLESKTESTLNGDYEPNEKTSTKENNLKLFMMECHSSFEQFVAQLYGSLCLPRTTIQIKVNMTNSFSPFFKYYENNLRSEFLSKVVFIACFKLLIRHFNHF